MTRPTGGLAAAACRHPALSLIAAMVLWVAVELAGVPAFREIPIMQLVWFRYLWHVLFMLIVLAPGAGLGFVRTGRPLLQVGRGLLMVAMPGSFALGAGVLPHGTLMALFWVAPILVVVAAYAIGERASASTWAAVLAGWVATLAMHRPLAPVGGAAVYPLAMAVSFAVYIVLTRVLDRSESMLTNLFYSGFVVLVALTPAMPFIWTPPSATALFFTAVVGILGFAALSLIDLALRVWPAPRVAVFLFTQVLVTRALEAVADGHLASKSLWAGSLLIAAAMFVESRRRSTPSEEGWSNAHA